MKCFIQSQSSFKVNCIFASFVSLVHKICSLLEPSIVLFQTFQELKEFFDLLGWLKSQVDLLLDKPNDKFIEEQKKKTNTKTLFPKHKEIVSLLTESLSAKYEMRTVINIAPEMLNDYITEFIVVVMGKDGKGQA